MEIQELSHWTAKRAGGRITITAIDIKTGKPVKIVGIDTIDKHSDMKRPIATHKDGAFFGLN